MNWTGCGAAGKSLISLAGSISIVVVRLTQFPCLNIPVISGDGYDHMFRVGKCKYSV
jgi:hypothetical protein